MLAPGNLTRYSGTDGTMGLALAHTGSFYPFFGPLLGWIGAAITGSDTSTNVLFGSLQKITAQQIGISAVLMCAANTCGGVMGKMVSSQSIVVATTAMNWYGQSEGRILPLRFPHQRDPGDPGWDPGLPGGLRRAIYACGREIGREKTWMGEGCT